jgi:hypothetical protein
MLAVNSVQTRLLAFSEQSLLTRTMGRQGTKLAALHAGMEDT